MRGPTFTCLLLPALVCASPAPRADELCPPIEEIIRAIAATETHAQADVTDRLSCHFPPGLSFNDAAARLDAGGFDLPNRIEPSFYRWNLRGDEFVARRQARGWFSTVEVRIIIHMTDQRIARFAAQYVAGG
ncbi:MAG: hypothetical protein ABW275_07830 [Hansschlegelia sp.]